MATIDQKTVLSFRASHPHTAKEHRAGLDPGFQGRRARQAHEGARAVLARLAWAARQIWL